MDTCLAAQTSDISGGQAPGACWLHWDTHLVRALGGATAAGHRQGLPGARRPEKSGQKTGGNTNKQVKKAEGVLGAREPATGSKLIRVEGKEKSQAQMGAAALVVPYMKVKGEFQRTAAFLRFLIPLVLGLEIHLVLFAHGLQALGFGCYLF